MTSRLGKRRWPTAGRVNRLINTSGAFPRISSYIQRLPYILCLFKLFIIIIVNTCSDSKALRLGAEQFSAFKFINSRTQPVSSSLFSHHAFAPKAIMIILLVTLCLHWEQMRKNEIFSLCRGGRKQTSSKWKISICRWASVSVMSWEGVAFQTHTQNILISQFDMRKKF